MTRAWGVLGFWLTPAVRRGRHIGEAAVARWWRVGWERDCTATGRPGPGSCREPAAVSPSHASLTPGRTSSKRLPTGVLRNMPEAASRVLVTESYARSLGAPGARTARHRACPAAADRSSVRSQSRRALGLIEPLPGRSVPLRSARYCPATRRRKREITSKVAAPASQIVPGLLKLAPSHFQRQNAPQRNTLQQRRPGRRQEIVSRSGPGIPSAPAPCPPGGPGRRAGRRGVAGGDHPDHPGPGARSGPARARSGSRVRRSSPRSYQSSSRGDQVARQFGPIDAAAARRISARWPSCRSSAGTRRDRG